MDNEMKDRQTDSMIKPLGELDDFEVADEFPDPRGWDVLASDGTKVGRVHELIVDSAAMQTRYLDVKVDGEVTGGDERRVLVPVGAAQLDDSKDSVMLGSLATNQVAMLPAYNGEEITRDYEKQIVQQIGAATAAGATGADAVPPKDFYSASQFDESRFYAPRRGSSAGATKPAKGDEETMITRSEEELSVGKERVKAGEVSIKRRVETEHVSKPVTKMHEEVNVERRPLEAGSQAAAGAKIGEEKISVPVMEEELVIEKRPVVMEEIVIKKTMVQDTEEVEADLRKERVEIEDTTKGTDGTGRDAR